MTDEEAPQEETVGPVQYAGEDEPGDAANVAVNIPVSSEEPVKELGSAAVSVDNPGELYSDGFQSSWERNSNDRMRYGYDFAEKELQESKTALERRHQQYEDKGFFGKRSKYGGKYVKEDLIPRAEAEVVKKQGDFDKVVEKINRYMGHMQAEAKAYAAAWQGYVDIQAKLAELTGIAAPEKQPSVEEYITRVPETGVFIEGGWREGIVDFLMPSQDIQVHRLGKEKTIRVHDLRPGVGMTGEKALELAESMKTTKLLAIKRSVEIPRHMLMPSAYKEFVSAAGKKGIAVAPEDSYLYIPVDDATAEILSKARLDKESFDARMNEKGEVGDSPFANIHTSFALMTPEQVKERLEWEAMPESAIFTLGDSEVFIKARTPEELRQQLEDELYRTSEARVISKGGNPVPIKNFLKEAA